MTRTWRAVHARQYLRRVGGHDELACPEDIRERRHDFALPARMQVEFDLVDQHDRGNLVRAACVRSEHLKPPRQVGEQDDVGPLAAREAADMDRRSVILQKMIVRQGEAVELKARPEKLSILAIKLANSLRVADPDSLRSTSRTRRASWASRWSHHASQVADRSQVLLKRASPGRPLGRGCLHSILQHRPVLPEPNPLSWR